MNPYAELLLKMLPTLLTIILPYLKPHDAKNVAQSVANAQMTGQSGPDKLSMVLAENVPAITMKNEDKDVTKDLTNAINIAIKGAKATFQGIQDAQ